MPACVLGHRIPRGAFDGKISKINPKKKPEQNDQIATYEYEMENPSSLSDLTRSFFPGFRVIRYWGLYHAVDELETIRLVRTNRVQEACQSKGWPVFAPPASFPFF
jgi:hypothetical protein